MYLLHGSARSVAYSRHELDPLHPCCASDASCMASTQRACYSATSCLAQYRWACADNISIASDWIPVTICLGTSSRSSRLSISCSQAPAVDQAAVRQMEHRMQEWVPA